MTQTQIKNQITEAAHCLLGISDDWGYFEVEQFLDWQLDNLEDLPEGYPVEVMTREHERAILDEIEGILELREKKEMFEKVNKGLGIQK
jgi:hypothetical protein